MMNIRKIEEYIPAESAGREAMLKRLGEVLYKNNEYASYREKGVSLFNTLMKTLNDEQQLLLLDYEETLVMQEDFVLDIVASKGMF